MSDRPKLIIVCAASLLAALMASDLWTAAGGGEGLPNALHDDALVALVLVVVVAVVVDLLRPERRAWWSPGATEEPRSPEEAAMRRGFALGARWRGADRDEQSDDGSDSTVRSLSRSRRPVIR